MGFPLHAWLEIPQDFLDTAGFPLSPFLLLFFLAFLPEQPASSVDTCSPLWPLPLLLCPWEMCPLFSLLPWSNDLSITGVFVLGFISRIGFREIPNYFDPRSKEVGALPRTCLPNAWGLSPKYCWKAGALLTALRAQKTTLKGTDLAAVVRRGVFLGSVWLLDEPSSILGTGSTAADLLVRLYQPLHSR